MKPILRRAELLAGAAFAHVVLWLVTVVQARYQRALERCEDDER